MVSLRALRFRVPTWLSLVSARTGTALAVRLFGATTVPQRAMGLMFRKLGRGEALLFLMARKERLSLHMLFVFFPIDVLFCERLREGFLVVDVRRRLRPFTFTTARALADAFVELPAGAAGEVRVGDLLVVKRPKDI
ncbi:DUF192 domain-containing protein [Candidatus Woesearchaeota archaeon]|nr:DUF192 domain-containing protein [Candidatus Woesearchaeota archaeon]